MQAGARRVPGRRANPAPLRKTRELAGHEAMLLIGQSIGNLVYNLRHVPRQHQNLVLDVLDALSAKMAAASAGSIGLDGQGIGNALYGLQHQPDSDAVRGFLRALERHLARDTWTERDVIKPHLQAPAAPRILAALYHRLKQPQERLDAALKDTAAECYRLFKAGSGLRFPPSGQKPLAHDLPGIAPGGAYSEHEESRKRRRLA